MKNQNIKIRKATPEDVPAILELIRELATYERAPKEVSVTEQELLKDGFGEQPLFHAIIAIDGDSIAGMALYFYSYSTWKGRCIYLEDIIVTQEKRRRGIGGLLFDELIRISHEFGARRLQWQVLEWNEPAISFYKKYGAHLDPEWVNGKLTPVTMAQFMNREAT